MNPWKRGVVALLLACPGLAAAQAQPQPRAPEFPIEFNEERDFATGFAVTLMLSLQDGLGRQCAALDGEDGTASRTALTQWDARNRELHTAAMMYIAASEIVVDVTEGPEAAAAFREQRRSEFARSVQTTQSQWFPEGKVDAPGCRKLTAQGASGLYDIQQQSEVAAHLAAIAADTAKLVK